MKFTPSISESDECDALCDWARLTPEIWNFLISLANQALCYTNPGVRKRMSRQGIKKGIPDYMLAIPRNGYGALFLEMKKKDLKGHKLRPEQEEWQIKLNSKGYKAVVVYGADEAIEAIKSYLGPVEEETY